MKSVRERVLDILESSSLSAPHDIADKILGDISPRERRAALAEVLPQFVRVVMTQRRHVPASDDPAMETAGNQTSSVGSSRWRRVSSVFTWRVKPEEWKSLRECTRDDVLALVAERRLLAAQNGAVADKFEALHKLMVRRRVAVVGDLPEAEVEGILR